MWKYISDINMGNYEYFMGGVNYSRFLLFILFPCEYFGCTRLYMWTNTAFLMRVSIFSRFFIRIFLPPPSSIGVEITCKAVISG